MQEAVEVAHMEQVQPVLVEHPAPAELVEVEMVAQ
jgi:hypothetical protein